MDTDKLVSAIESLNEQERMSLAHALHECNREAAVDLARCIDIVDMDGVFTEEYLAENPYGA